MSGELCLEVLVVLVDCLCGLVVSAEVVGELVGVEGLLLVDLGALGRVLGLLEEGVLEGLVLARSE